MVLFPLLIFLFPLLNVLFAVPIYFYDIYKTPLLQENPAFPGSAGKKFTIIPFES